MSLKNALHKQQLKFHLTIEFATENSFPRGRRRGQNLRDEQMKIYRLLWVNLLIDKYYQFHYFLRPGEKYSINKRQAYLIRVSSRSTRQLNVFSFFSMTIFSRLFYGEHDVQFIRDARARDRVFRERQKKTDAVYIEFIKT